MLGPGVFVTASDYSLDPEQTIKSQITRERDIVIGDDVWIGAGSIITAGVEIGDGAVIGAGGASFAAAISTRRGDRGRQRRPAASRLTGVFRPPRVIGWCPEWLRTSLSSSSSRTDPRCCGRAWLRCNATGSPDARI